MTAVGQLSADVVILFLSGAVWGAGAQALVGGDAWRPL